MRHPLHASKLKQFLHSPCGILHMANRIGVKCHVIIMLRCSRCCRCTCLQFAKLPFILRYIARIKTVRAFFCLPIHPQLRPSAWNIQNISHAFRILGFQLLRHVFRHPDNIFLFRHSLSLQIIILRPPSFARRGSGWFRTECNPPVRQPADTSPCKGEVATESHYSFPPGIPPFFTASRNSVTIPFTNASGSGTKRLINASIFS